MKSHHKYLIGILLILAAGGAYYSQKSSPVPQPVPAPAPALVPTPTPTTSACDGLDTIWQHVYTGDPRKFQKPQDRLTIIEPCKTITGTIINAVAEKDSDWHIRLDVDDKSLLNQYNISGQHGYLVVEPVCSNNPPTQNDVIKEGVCDNFSQSVFDQNFIGKRVSVTGAYVTDQEHHWNEIHPVSKIEVIK